MRNKRILTIDPGTRNMGIAVFNGKRLLYYGVHTFQKMESQQALQKISKAKLTQLVEDFSPEIIVYEKTFFKNNPTSKAVNTLTHQIKSIGKRKDIKVIGVSATTVRKIVCGTGKATKRDVATVLVSIYPQLSPYLINDKRWKEDFHFNMFDAIALRLAIDE